MRVRLNEKAVCWLLGAALLVLVVPLLWLGRYNVPCYDDFSFSARVAAAWNENHSLWQTFAAAGEQTADYYMTWQGTFSGVFLMSLCPLVFGEQFYVIVPWLMLGALTGCTLFFFATLFRRVFGVSAPFALSTGFVVLLLWTQLVPDASQSFYWYNGSVYYTFLFSLSLLFYGLLIITLQEKRPKGRALWLVLCSVLAVLVGGGNYVSALVTALVLIGLLAGLALAKRPEWKWLLIPGVIFMVCFLLNITAPGNNGRLAIYSWEPSVPAALWMALRFVFLNAREWLNLPVVLLLAWLTPVFWQAVQGAAFKFRFPGLVWIGSAALFAAMYCPSTYTEYSSGPSRLRNIIFYGFILLLVLDWFYLVGWLARKKKETCRGSEHRTGTVGLVFSVCIAGVLGMLVLFVGNTHLTGSEPDYSFSSLEAVYSLRSGEAAVYYSAFQERLEVLKDPNTDMVSVEPYPTKPRLLFVDDQLGPLVAYYGKQLAE